MKMKLTKQLHSQYHQKEQNTSLVKFIPKYFVLFDGIVNGAALLISFSYCSSLLYRNITIFLCCELILLKPLFWASLWKTKATSVWGFPRRSPVKNPPANAGDKGSIPGLGRSPRIENGNPFQYSCLENPMDKGVWQVIVHTVPKSCIWFSG